MKTEMTKNWCSDPLSEEFVDEELDELDELGDDSFDNLENEGKLERGADGQLYEHRRVVADQGQNPLRVDKFLTDHLRGTTRHRIQLAAEAGFIHVNGRPVKSNYKVKPNDVVTLMFSHPRRETEIIPQDIPLNIVFEDDELMVVNKPAGMCVHPGCGNYEGTLVNAIAWHLKDDPKFDPNDPTVGLVHRIDKDTSGLLVVAKTAEAKTHLCHQFFVHSTKRQYNALVWGNFVEDEGRIEGNIGRHPKDRLQMWVYPPDSAIGKPAVTHYKVLERFGHTSWIECRLETGRTHQIRAHMRHIGHILFADERYGGCEIIRGEQSSTYKAFIHNCFDLCPRQALHARTLGFVHPRTGEEMFFQCDVPSDMQAVLEKWRAKSGLRP